MVIKMDCRISHELICEFSTNLQIIVKHSHHLILKKNFNYTQIPTTASIQVVLECTKYSNVDSTRKIYQLPILVELLCYSDDHQCKQSKLHYKHVIKWVKSTIRVPRVMEFLTTLASESPRLINCYQLD